MSGPDPRNDMKYSNVGQNTQTGEANFEPGPSERSLSGNIGKFAMNQLLGGKKPDKSGGSGGGLGALAGQLLGAPSHGGNGKANTGLTNIAGSVVTNLLGGKKQEKPNGPVSQPKPSHGSLMSAVGGLLGKHDKPNNFGYSQNGGHSGSYSGSTPSNSYYHSSTGNSHHPTNSATSQQGEHYYSHSHNNNQTQQDQFSHSHSSQPYNPPPPSQYNKPHNPANHQPHFSQYQPTYDAHTPPPSYQATPQHNPTGFSHGGAPIHSGGHPQGNYQNYQNGYRPEHQNNQYGGYEGSNNPPSSAVSHQNNQQASHSSPGGYGGQQKW